MAMVTESRVLHTQVSTLDEVLGGGLLPGHYMVIGDPGSGYEILVRQILFSALRQGYPCIYVALDSSPDRIRREMKYFGWDAEEFEKKGKFRFVDCSIYWVGLEDSHEKFYVRNLRDLAQVRSAIITARNEVGTLGIGVFESFSTLVNHIGFEKAHTIFNFLQARLEQMDIIGLTMFTRDALPKQQIASFSAIADGIIDMRIRRSVKGSDRRMRIEKYGPEHEFTGWFPYRISREGLSLMGTVSQRIKATLDRF